MKRLHELDAGYLIIFAEDCSWYKSKLFLYNGGCLCCYSG